jgi:lysyl endopeptidase
LTLRAIISIQMLVLTAMLNAQVDRSGQPLSWNIPQQISTSTIWQTLPAINQIQLADEDAIALNDKSTPIRFAKSFAVNFDPLTSGTWTNLPNGDRIWMIGVESEGAFSIGVQFSDLFLPQGATIYIYNETHTDYIGPLTSNENKLNLAFNLPPVKGSKIIVEYYEPFAYRGDGYFEISSATHGYRDIHSMESVQNLDCFMPLLNSATALQNASSSVLMMIVDNGQRIATSTLVNNTANNGVPYVLTAQSALVGLPSTWTFLFDVAGEKCTNTNTLCWSKAICGAEVVATDSDHGTALVKLKDTPKPSWKAFYSGWYRGGFESVESLVSIQNSMGLPQSVAQYTGEVWMEIWNNKEVMSFDNWTQGQAFKGAAGSPIFDANKNLIGVYLGGNDDCAESGTEHFAALAASWDAYSIYLNPINASVNELHGIYPIVPNTDSADERVEVIVFPNPAQDWIYIQNNSDKAIGAIELRDALGRLVSISASLFPTLDISYLTEGIYTITFLVGDKSVTQKLLVR